MFHKDLYGLTVTWTGSRKSRQTPVCFNQRARSGFTERWGSQIQFGLGHKKALRPFHYVRLFLNYQIKMIKHILLTLYIETPRQGAWNKVFFIFYIKTTFLYNKQGRYEVRYHVLWCMCTVLWQDDLLCGLAFFDYLSYFEANLVRIPWRFFDWSSILPSHITIFHKNTTKLKRPVSAERLILDDESNLVPLIKVQIIKSFAN